METTHLYHIGKMIRTVRESRKITQRELSDKAGLSRFFIIQIESGEVNFSIESLVEIANALGCTLDIILTPAN